MAAISVPTRDDIFPFEAFLVIHNSSPLSVKTDRAPSHYVQSNSRADAY